ncbi:IQ motif EF-hand binding site [Arabidopsis suecica]|uniref:IQ motif EF-hand binding site n=1 Tax=Arabidopsis suecica TaxID=45249 RepID=A0A8T2F5F3_ARASU|nr:IQ motif EF-hand binding site [Arabidopsis suecica]
MGSGWLLRSIICLNGTKKNKSNRGNVHSETSNRVKPVESSSAASTKLTVEVAVIHIQKAFRAFKARKRLCSLKSARRFNSLIQGHTVMNQTSTALNVIHSWYDIQNQIRARRLYMVTQGRLQHKRLENRLKLEIKLHELEVEWCGGSETMEEILAKIQQKEEATVKRERAMAYAFSHQWRANATQYLGQASFNLGKESWGWSWKERWIAARPWEIRAQCYVVKPIKPSKKPEKSSPNNVITKTSAKPDEVGNSKKPGSG